MKTSHFAISWIYEELHVCRVARDKVVEHWVSPDPVEDLADFNVALVQASASLGMQTGGDIAITYESDEHAHVFLDLPPMPQRDLEQYLQRRVDQEKSFDDPAVWSYRHVEHDDGSIGVLLHLMPKSILDAVLRICHESHIVPTRMVPLTDVMVQHLPVHLGEPNDVLLVVALFESRIEFVVTTPQGEAIFVRELKYHWREDHLDRLRLDIDRTVLYVKQRNRNIASVLLMGVEASSAAEVIGAHVSFPVVAYEPGTQSVFWAHEVSRLPNDSSSNFIPRSVRRTINCKLAVRSTSWLAVAAVLCAIVTTVWVEILVWNQSATDPALVRRVDSLLEQRSAFEKRSAELNALQRKVELLNPRHPPLPAWFLSRLDEIVPPEAVLSKAKLQLDERRWNFEIEGATTPTLARSAATLVNIERSLESAPWLASVGDNWRAEWIGMLHQGRAAETGRIGFRLSGVVGQ